MKDSVKLRTLGWIVFCAIFTLFSVSCHRATEKTGEKMVEKAFENATGQKADIDISEEKTVIETGSGSVEVDSKANSWPDEIPDEIPEFTYGKISAVTTSNIDGIKAWNIVFEEVKDGFIDKYDAKLKEKGFETVTMKMGEKGGSITGENEKYTIFMMGGEGNLSFAVSLKKRNSG